MESPVVSMKGAVLLEDSYLMLLQLHDSGGEDFREGILMIECPDTSMDF